MTDPAGIPALIDAIRRLHGCEATHVETVPVREVFNGEVMWQGEVEVFDVTGYPMATRVYASLGARDGRWRQQDALGRRGPCRGRARRGAAVKAHKGPGRPGLPKGTARTGSFTVKVSDDERAKIEAASARAGKPATTWAREILLAACSQT
jgi:hypothetical protein